MAARWYEPGTGGFSSRDTWLLDPTASGQRANRYSYGFGSPLNGTDPSGHVFPLVLGAAVGWNALGRGIFGTTVVGGGALVIDKHQRAKAGAMSSGYAGSGALSHTYAAAASAAARARAALRAQAARFSRTGTKSRAASGSKVGGGRSSVGGGTRYVPRYYPRAYTRYSGGGGGGGVAVAAVRVPVRPPAPPIDQNPNNGSSPRPVPDRPAPRPDWDPKGSGWKPGSGWDVVMGALQMLDLLDGGGFDPQENPELHPAPGAAPGDGNTSGDSGDCRGHGAAGGTTGRSTLCTGTGPQASRRVSTRHSSRLILVPGPRRPLSLRRLTPGRRSSPPTRGTGPRSSGGTPVTCWGSSSAETDSATTTWRPAHGPPTRRRWTGATPGSTPTWCSTRIR